MAPGSPFTGQGCHPLLSRQDGCCTAALCCSQGCSLCWAAPCRHWSQCEGLSWAGVGATCSKGCWA